MRMLTRTMTQTAVFLSLATGFAASARAQDAQALTEEGVISGTMNIEFKTRTSQDSSGDLVEGSPAIGVQDNYSFDLVIAKTTEFSGKIVRQPNLYTRLVRKIKQGASLGFDVTLSVMNPSDLKQKKAVGKWVGVVPINTATGAYELNGGTKDERPLRIDVDQVGAAKGFKDMFAGRLVGKAEKKDNLAEYHYKRLVGTKEVEITVKRSDPMKFEGIELAKGPSEIYPHTLVNGRLDYDYETGNWFTDGIRFKYAVNGKEFEDVVTGSIRWVEDANRKGNGKGHYDFNLRFNEDKNKSAKSEADAFKNMSAEEAFFSVDDTVPCLTGTVDYVDTFKPGTDTPTMSKVTFKLNANKLTKQQIMNFAKLWLLGIGPTNDE